MHPRQDKIKKLVPLIYSCKWSEQSLIGQKGRYTVREGCLRWEFVDMPPNSRLQVSDRDKRNAADSGAIGFLMFLKLLKFVLGKT